MTTHAPLKFTPPRWLRNGHAMTVAGSLARLPPRLALRRERWELPDGDFLDLDHLDGATADAPLVVVCHGLEGSSRAGYVLGVMKQVAARGLAAVALNFRGCSGGLNRLARFYHAGETADLALLLDRLLREQPTRPIGLCGFSLGGNVVAKYLGERGEAAPPQVRAAAVISVPFDLSGCSDAIDGPGVPALIYRERFLRKLRPKAEQKAARFPGVIDLDRLRRLRLLRDFDDTVTAPLHGFAGAADYYARSSSGPLLTAVRRPLLVVSAEDDPFVPAATLPLAAIRDNQQVTALITPAGGHVGFLHGPPWALRRWAEERAADFVSNHLLSS